MPPNQIHLYKPAGTGVGLGDPLPGSGAPVLQRDSWAAAIVDELERESRDIKVDKYRNSGFWDTPLDSILRNLGTRTVVFSGVNTDQCVLHSLTDANSWAMAASWSRIAAPPPRPTSAPRPRCGTSRSASASSPIQGRY